MSTMETCVGCGNQIHGYELPTGSLRRRYAWLDNANDPVCPQRPDEGHVPEVEWSVTWATDLMAGTPTEAAEAALEIQRDRESIATIFDVEADVPMPDGTMELQTWRVDLSEGTAKRLP